MPITQAEYDNKPLYLKLYDHHMWYGLLIITCLGLIITNAYSLFASVHESIKTKKPVSWIGHVIGIFIELMIIRWAVSNVESSRV